MGSNYGVERKLGSDYQVFQKNGGFEKLGLYRSFFLVGNLLHHILLFEIGSAVVKQDGRNFSSCNILM